MLIDEAPGAKTIKIVYWAPKSAGMAVYLMLNEMPRFAAITLVAPTVRFRALAILLAPFLSFAIVFNVR